MPGLVVCPLPWLMRGVAGAQLPTGTLGSLAAAHGCKLNRHLLAGSQGAAPVSRETLVCLSLQCLPDARI